MNEPISNGVKRGELARLCGVNIETLRYYEQRGLLPTPERDVSNHRVYDEEAVRRLQFIGRAQDLGFTLDEIKELFELRADRSADCADLRERAVRKIASIDEKLALLHSMRRTLAELRDACPGAGDTSACPILGALDQPTPAKSADTCCAAGKEASDE